MNERGSTVDLGLAGKAALVIGTGGGMGQATVAALAGAGADVACFDLDEAAAAAAAQLAETAGVNSHAITGSATRHEDLDRAAAETKSAFGAIDIVVTVVGGGSDKGRRLLDTEDDDFDRTFDLNLKPVVYSVKAAAGHMIEQGRGGSFVFISSVGGLSGLPGQAPYSAGKASLMAIIKTLALEYGMEGIRFNAVAPGTIFNPKINRISTPEDRAEQERLIPLRRMGRPEDIANVILFLNSDLGSYVTGQTIAVDGGVTAKYQLPAFWADWERD